MSVVVLDCAGASPGPGPGATVSLPRAEGDSIGARATGYYVELEARRHTEDGGVAIAGVLIWAHPAVPDRERSLAELFRERTEVDLAVYPPGTAPESAEVFDYEEPTTAGPAAALQRASRCRRSRATASELAYERGSRVVTWLVLAALAWPSRSRRGPLERIAILAALVWLPVRAPIGPALGVQPLFSPATFFGRCWGRCPAPRACWRSRARC